VTWNIVYSPNIVPVSGGGGGSDSLTSDPYSAYSTRVVDSATASDVAGGTTRTVTVNGVSGSYQCYKSIPYAVNDYLTQGGRRIVVISATTLAADIVFPSASGLSDSTRVILQGDPAAAAPLDVDLNSVYRLAPSQSGNRSYITVRKLDLHNLLRTAGYSFAVMLQDFDCTNMTIEFCKIRDVSLDISDNVSAIWCTGVDTSGLIVRYSKISNVTNPGGTGCGILAYQTKAAQIYNCDINIAQTNGFNIRVKEAASTFPNGWTIRNNKIYGGSSAGIRFDVAGYPGNPRHEGHRFYKNLFYNLDTAILGYCFETSTQSTDCAIYQNTFGQDVNEAIVTRAVTAVDIHSNLILSATNKIVCEVATTTLAYANGYTRVDYNSYYTGAGTNWRMDRYGTEQVLSSLATWKTAKSVSSRSELTSDPDAHALSFATLASGVPNYATRDYSYSAGAGLGLAGVNIGYDTTDIGPGW
jgi:hypothetical protein